MAAWAEFCFAKSSGIVTGTRLSLICTLAPGISFSVTLSSLPSLDTSVFSQSTFASPVTVAEAFDETRLGPGYHSFLKWQIGVCYGNDVQTIPRCVT